MGRKHFENIAITLRYSASEYTCPVWKASAHVKNIDIALKESCRIITGCLRPTEINKLYILSGLAIPDIRRTMIAESERYKCNQDSRLSIHEYVATEKRFKSRQNCMHSTQGDLLKTRKTGYV